MINSQYAQNLKEQFFLQSVNTAYKTDFTSIQQVIDNHDCKLSPHSGCNVCDLLMIWGFVPETPQEDFEDYDYAIEMSEGDFQNI